MERKEDSRSFNNNALTTITTTTTQRQHQTPLPAMHAAPPRQHQHQQQQHQYRGVTNGHHQLTHPPSQHPHDYRASPNGTPPASSMSLPSIHHFEGGGGGGQPAMQHNHYSHSPAPPLPPPPAPAPVINPGAQALLHQQQHAPHLLHNPFKYQNSSLPPAMPSNAPNSQNGMIRYPLPPHAPLDPTHMAAGRHKKEIKRRTKTGCLTCRKRRIKCDEGHPNCRNCAKSKRECLGYDPIFKQQPAPAPIQPAPTLAGGLPGKPVALQILPPNHYQAYPSPGAQYASAHQLSHIPTNAPLDSSYGYNTSLDPALGPSEHRARASQSNLTPNLEAARKVKSITIEQLYSIGGTPPPHYATNHPNTYDKRELLDLFNNQFASALDQLFETTWYSSRGSDALISNQAVCDLIAKYKTHTQIARTDYNSTQVTMSLQAELVWRLATLPRTLVTIPTAPSIIAGVQDLLPRIDIIENLITGQILDPARIPPPPPIAPSEPTLNTKYNEQSFWHELGKVTSSRDDSGDPAILHQIADILGSIRINLLRLRENRDVLYSIAICRHIGGRTSNWDPRENHLPQSYDQESEVSKLRVAHHFVQSEDQRGTNPVIQRICGMALRSWMLP